MWIEFTPSISRGVWLWLDGFLCEQRVFVVCGVVGGWLCHDFPISSLHAVQKNEDEFRRRVLLWQSVSVD